ncbi:hypothetical protein AGMMS49942_10120 [Spirochaetia bacterium]|nr:hypothetical protein AGMMS49942_10120 [Spirochaetia bacterium]
MKKSGCDLRRSGAALFVILAVLGCFGCKTAPEVISTDTYYVSAAGNDANNGLTAKTPFKTLKKALDTAKEGAYRIITVLGTLNAASEGANEGSSVFTARTTGDAVITIRGADANAALSALNAGKRVIEIVGNSHIRLENIEISGGSIAEADISKGGGGGILIAGSTTNGATLIAAKGAVIKNNQAQGGGGVAVGGKGSSFTLEGGEVRENKSSTVGGGILSFQESALELVAGLVEGNTAATQGGGISVGSGTGLTLKGGEIIGNQAEDGGGFHVAGTAEMQGGKINGNSSPSNGGGVYVSNGGSFTLTDGEIQGNKALTAGGGVSIYGGTFAMQNGVIAGNTAASTAAADGTGGGVFIIEGSFDFSGGSITGNSASNSGGGVNANRDSTFTMTGGEIGGNSAEVGGGGVAVLGANNRFKKTGGVIYGIDADPAQQNTTTDQNGNSVNVSKSGDLRVAVITEIKRRRNTASRTNLDSSVNGDAGGWER